MMREIGERRHGRHAARHVPHVVGGERGGRAPPVPAPPHPHARPVHHLQVVAQVAASTTYYNIVVRIHAHSNEFLERFASDPREVCRVWTNVSLDRKFN